MISLEKNPLKNVAKGSLAISFFSYYNDILNALQVYPIVYVGDNAILDVMFRLFSYNAPEGYEEVMIEQTIL